MSLTRTAECLFSEATHAMTQVFVEIFKLFFSDKRSEESFINLKIIDDTDFKLVGIICNRFHIV